MVEASTDAVDCLVEVFLRDGFEEEWDGEVYELDWEVLDVELLDGRIFGESEELSNGVWRRW